MEAGIKLKAFRSGVFHAYDVRGRYPEELDLNTVELSTLGFAEYLKWHQEKELCLLGRDLRWSSEEISSVVRNALLSAGLDVLDVGVTTIPMFIFALAEKSAAGGIMVTASHNLASFNGLKFYEETRSLHEFSGLQEIKNIVESGKLQFSESIGQIQKEDFTGAYLEFLTSGAALGRKVEAVFDAGGGTTGAILPLLVGKLGISAELLNLAPDPALIKRDPNPLMPAAQKSARAALLKNKAAVGFIFDPDGDRIVVLDEKGAVVRGDSILWLLANYFVHAHDTVVSDLRASQALYEDLEKKEIRVLASRVGRSFIQDLMRQEDALLGGELSGHFYFKENFYSDSALLTAVRILQILSLSSQTLSALIHPYERYFYSGDINLAIADKDGALSALYEKYRGGEKLYLDGLTVKYPEWRFNIRPSQTENLLRLVIEARDRRAFDEKKDELLAFLFGLGAKLA